MLNLQFRFSPTGEVEWWILNEDGSITLYAGSHNLAVSSQIEQRLKDGLTIGENLVFCGFRLTPFYEWRENGDGK